MFNGTFEPVLNSTNELASLRTSRTYEGWSTVNARGYGGLAIAKGFVLATDMETSGAEANGIVAFASDGSAHRILEGVDAIDVAVDCNGIVHALAAGGRTIHSQHVRGDSSVLRGLDVEATAIGVTPSGSLLVATRDGFVALLEPDGAPVGSFFVGSSPIVDLDIAPDGMIVGASFDGEVTIASLRLEALLDRV